MAATDSTLLEGQQAGSCVHSGRAILNYWVDTVMLAAGAVVFPTALVLLTRFHMGHGAFATSAFGIPRLVWLNTHRLAAIVVLAGVAAHSCLHCRTIIMRVSRAFKDRPGKAKASDLVLYFCFALDLLTGFLAWLLLPGSAPLYGPVRLGHLEPMRHMFIDLHNFAGLALLPAVVIHTCRHLRWILRTSGQLLLHRRAG
jgi:hypothetical protein